MAGIGSKKADALALGLAAGDSIAEAAGRAGVTVRQTGVPKQSPRRTHGRARMPSKARRAGQSAFPFAFAEQLCQEPGAFFLRQLHQLGGTGVEIIFLIAGANRRRRTRPVPSEWDGAYLPMRCNSGLSEFSPYVQLLFPDWRFPVRPGYPTR